jgi:hypothetical protein
VFRGRAGSNRVVSQLFVLRRATGTRAHGMGAMSVAERETNRAFCHKALILLIIDEWQGDDKVILAKSGFFEAIE